MKSYPLKVLILSDLYPSPVNEHRGIFVFHQVKELMRQGMDVRVISPVPYVPPAFRFLYSKWSAYASLPEKQDWEGTKVYHPRYIALPGGKGMQFYGYSYYAGAAGLIKELWNSGFHFDLIHSHVALPDGFAGMLFSKKYHRPHVVTIHGQDLSTTVFRNKACRRAVIEVLKSSDKAILVSKKLRGLAESLTGDGGNMEIIHNGYHPVNPEVRKPIEDFPKGRPALISVGHLLKLKGHDDTISALAKLSGQYPDITLTIIGDGPEEEALKALCRELGVEHRVFFAGRKSNSELRQYIKQSDLFVLPSWNEGFGIVYLEAMAEGKPVFACQGQGIEDVITSGENGVLVPPKDPEHLAGEIRRLLEDDILRLEMGKRGQHFVRQHYTWESKGKEILHVYQELCEKS